LIIWVRNGGIMSERRVGFHVSKDKVIAVDAEVPESGPIVLQADHTWNLQRGAREEAYHVLYQQVANYLREHDITRAVVKASAVSGRSAMRLAHLEGAEVRGIIIAAARSVCAVCAISKAKISKTFGDR